MGGVKDFWEHPYYKHVKTISSMVGQWPYQSTRDIIIFRSVIFITVTTQLIAQARACYKYRNDTEVVLEAISPFIVDTVAFIKLMNHCYHFRRFISLLNQIREHWMMFPHNNGLHRLHYYTNYARKLTIIYLIAFYGGAVIFITEPIQERISYAILYPNITLPKKFAVPMDFGSIDADRWYYPLFLGSTFAILVIMTLVTACDLLLFVFVAHACGLFKALGYAIEHLPPSNDSEVGDYSYDYMKSCAIVHKHAIHFSEGIKDMYIWSFFGMIGLNMIIMSVTAMQVMLHLDAVGNIVKYVVLMSVEMTHLFVQCVISQSLLDASFQLRETLSNAEWYNSSKKTRRIIPLMLIRSQTPIALTAGKTIIMNMNTYAVVLKTAVSYFTVFLAMQ